MKYALSDFISFNHPCILSSRQYRQLWMTFISIRIKQITRLTLFPSIGKALESDLGFHAVFLPFYSPLSNFCSSLRPFMSNSLPSRSSIMSAKAFSVSSICVSTSSSVTLYFFVSVFILFVSALTMESGNTAMPSASGLIHLR